MAFTAEDGTGVVGANSLVSVAAADTYWADRGSAAWAALTTGQKQAALIAASEYLSGAFPWVGIKSSASQLVAWPRAVWVDGLGYFTTSIAALNSWVTDYSGVPVPVQHATIRIAGAVGVDGVDLFGTVGADAGVRRVKAGSVEVEYSDAAVSVGLDGRPSFPWLNDFLRDYLEPAARSSISRKVVRV